MTPIFDGHNDILLRLWLAGDNSGQRFINGNAETHIDWPRAQAGGLAGGFCHVHAFPRQGPAEHRSH